MVPLSLFYSTTSTGQRFNVMGQRTKAAAIVKKNNNLLNKM